MRAIHLTTAPGTFATGDIRLAKDALGRIFVLDIGMH